MWLFSKLSTYPELGQIQNWPKKLYLQLYVIYVHWQD